MSARERPGRLSLTAMPTPTSLCGSADSDDLARVFRFDLAQDGGRHQIGTVGEIIPE
jgi:hypothetical protein